MSIIASIKEQQIAARKARDAKTAAFLSTLASEIEIIGKNDGNRQTTDDEATKVIQKFKKNATEMVAQLTKLGKDTADSMVELEILDSFLPKQATDEEVINEIRAFAATGVDPVTKIGIVIKHLKSTFGPTFDAARVKALISQV
jgi:uncharacterized protein YqeY